MISLRDGMGSGWDGKFFRRRRRRRRRRRPPQGGGGEKGVIFQEKKPPEAACWPDAGLLKRKGIFDKYRDVQKMMPIWPSDSYGFASGKRDRPPIPPSL